MSEENKIKRAENLALELTLQSIDELDDSTVCDQQNDCMSDVILMDATTDWGRMCRGVEIDNLKCVFN